MRRVLRCAVGVALVLAASEAHAAGPIGRNGSPITTSAYQVDLFEGPVLTSNRIIGMGGAFTAVAAGVDGFNSNPAAGAVRMPWSYSWFDYELSAGLTLPGSLTSTDFDNDGKVGFAYRNFLFFTFGGNVQLGAWSIGVGAALQQYDLGNGAGSPGAPAAKLQLQLGVVRLFIARSFFDGALAIGGGVRNASFDLSATPIGSTKQQDLFAINAGGGEIGALVAPIGQPFRLGLAYRSRLVADQSSRAGSATTNSAGDVVAGGRVLPTAAVLPWEIEAGVAWQIGPRPLNVAYVNPHDPPADFAPECVDATDPANRKWDKKKIEQRLRARNRALPRQRLLLSASVVVSGPTANGVSVESFLRQTVERAGQAIVVSPHLGAEAEPLPMRLQTRVGTYLEPSRFRGIDPRLHGTVGADVRLFDWTAFGLFDEDATWRVGGSLDVANRYFGWGVTAGLWH